MARRNQAAPVALGGIFASLAVVIMCLGGMIPAATCVCPMLCMILLSMVMKKCSSRICWAWYGAVSILSILLSADKEAAAVFVFLGYYPILKPKMDGLPLKWLWKLILFNVAILLLYTLLIHVFGVAQVIEDFEELGTVMTVVTLILGNVTFFMLDKLLSVRFKI